MQQRVKQIIQLFLFGKLYKNVSLNLCGAKETFLHLFAGALQHKETGNKFKGIEYINYIRQQKRPS